MRATLMLPVIHSYTTERGAHLPADRSNLDELRALIEEGAREAPHRIELADWIVEPEEGPPPDARGTAPHANWTVFAEFVIA